MALLSGTYFQRRRHSLRLMPAGSRELSQLVVLSARISNDAANSPICGVGDHLWMVDCH